MEALIKMAVAVDIQVGKLRYYKSADGKTESFEIDLAVIIKLIKKLIDKGIISLADIE